MRARASYSQQHRSRKWANASRPTRWCSRRVASPASSRGQGDFDLGEELEQAAGDAVINLGVAAAPLPLAAGLAGRTGRRRGRSSSLPCNPRIRICHTRCGPICRNRLAPVAERLTQPGLGPPQTPALLGYLAARWGLVLLGEQHAQERFPASVAALPLGKQQTALVVGQLVDGLSQGAAGLLEGVGGGCGGGRRPRAGAAAARGASRSRAARLTAPGPGGRAGRGRSRRPGLPRPPAAPRPARRRRRDSLSPPAPGGRRRGPRGRPRCRCPSRAPGRVGPACGASRAPPVDLPVHPTQPEAHLAAVIVVDRAAGGHAVALPCHGNAPFYFVLTLSRCSSCFVERFRAGRQSPAPVPSSPQASFPR